MLVRRNLVNLTPVNAPSSSLQPVIATGPEEDYEKPYKMMKALQNRQLGMVNERTFVAEQVNERLMNMIPCIDEFQLTDELYQVLELSHDNELLLASTVDEFQIFNAKTYIPQYKKLTCRGNGFLNSDGNPVLLPRVSLLWNRTDHNMFTKTGGTGTLEIWDVNALSGPRDTSPLYGERDYQNYAYHALDAEDMCVISALEERTGTINVLDIRIGLETPVMKIQDNTASKTLGTRKFANLAYNPAISHRLTTVGYFNRPGKPPCCQMSDYDTRTGRKPLFSYDLYNDARMLNEYIPIQFSGDAHKVYTAIAGDLYCFDTTNGRLLNRVLLYEKHGLTRPNFRVSYGSTPEHLFIPLRYGIKVFDANKLSVVSRIPLPEIPSHRNDSIPIALDTTRQIMYVADAELRVYCTLSEDNHLEQGLPKPSIVVYIDK